MLLLLLLLLQVRRSAEVLLAVAACSACWPRLKLQALARDERTDRANARRTRSDRAGESAAVAVTASLPAKRVRGAAARGQGPTNGEERRH